MNRRSFVAALVALPVVRRLMPAKAKGLRPTAANRIGTVMMRTGQLAEGPNGRVRLEWSDWEKRKLDV